MKPKNLLKNIFEICQFIKNSRFGVRAVPTFSFLKEGKTLATVRGGNKDQLVAKLKEVSATANQKPPPGAPAGMADLAQFIDKVSLTRTFNSFFYRDYADILTL